MTSINSMPLNLNHSSFVAPTKLFVMTDSPIILASTTMRDNVSGVFGKKTKPVQPCNRYSPVPTGRYPAAARYAYRHDCTCTGTVMTRKCPFNPNKNHDNIKSIVELNLGTESKGFPEDFQRISRGFPNDFQRF